jgi:hypothetical protein
MIPKLRNHILIGGLSTREPADGAEGSFRVSLGFEPAWYHQRCGVEFTVRWHEDPLHRAGMLRRMKAELKRAFPSVPYWDSSNREGTLSGAYGIGVVARAFGMSLVYASDRWPTLDPAGRLSVREIERLDVDRVLESEAVENLFRPMDIIEREWGLIFGYPNWQGVLNTAFHLRGPEIFIDLYDRPEFAHRFLDLIAEVMIRLVSQVEERQRKSGFDVNLLSVSNCVMNMLSPEHYREFVQPRDRRIAESFARFGVHTCEWDVTPYIEVLSELPKLGYLDMGMMSDMARVRRTFPDTYRAVLYSPVKLQGATQAEIRQDMEKTPDDRVNVLLEICADIAG